MCIRDSGHPDPRLTHCHVGFSSRGVHQNLPDSAVHALSEDPEWTCEQQVVGSDPASGAKPATRNALRISSGGVSRPGLGDLLRIQAGDLPDPMVVKVGDVDGAVGGDGHPGRPVELGGGAGAVSKPGSAVSGEGGDLAGGRVDGPDSMVGSIGDVDGAVKVNRHTCLLYTSRCV